VTSYLLDTNVISELFKKKPSAAVLERVRSVPPQALATSVVCVTELRYGTARHPRGGALWKRIVSEVLSRIDVLSLRWEESIRAGDLMAALQRSGQPLGIEDVLIAATALERDLVVVTRNVKHFARIERLSVESWWP